MNSPNPQHSSQPPHGPPMPYPRPGREPMRGGAITGGILALSSTGVTFLLTFAPWAYEPVDIFSNPFEQNLWELAGNFGFFPFGFFGMVAFANAVLSVIFLSVSTTRQRRGAATILTMTAFIQFIVYFNLMIAADENELASDGGLPWALSFLAGLVLIAGSITAVVGCRSPAVEPVGPPSAPVTPNTPPPPPQGEPERSLTSSIEELAALRDKGFLSEAEFEQKRRKILGLD